jgi:aminoglycoside phosphotransferase (APT) family kinase protein
MNIDEALVRRLVTVQFPQWKDLPVRPVALSGWDNRTFHLGEEMLVRMPSAADYALQVEKEQRWLPKLAPSLPVAIPIPLAIGEPTGDYPWKWSIYRWLEGETAAAATPADLAVFAADLAQFLTALQRIDTTDGPLPGLHSFYRGGSLTHYAMEVKQALAALNGKVDVEAAMKLWKEALATTWQQAPVWVHGDLSAGNLLVREGRLCAVIDFGQLAVGDPACDLVIAWTLFKGQSREVFRRELSLDAGTWLRGSAWTLWKALIVAAGFTNPGNAESAECWRIIKEVLADYD